MATAQQALPLNLAAFNRMNATQKLAVLAAIALAIALLVGGLLWAKEPTYGVVFANLAEKDGGQIVAALEQQNIPYRISEGGSAILVPSHQVHDVRLRLASQGLPKGGLVGFEVMETQKLGISQFAEQINYQRALEGELARSIQSLAAVKGARVHLAIPKQTAFLRDDQKPTASVLVALHPGRTLEPAQVSGIVHLVSASVPQLSPVQVSVIDQDGNLVSTPSNNGKTAGLDPSQIKYVRDIEEAYRHRIEAILGPLVGTSNVRAQVTAEVDFSETEQVAETYRPNPNPDTAIRSQQSAEQGSPGGGAAIGVPGALTNQPPVPATAPITSPPVAGAANAGGGASSPLTFSKNATVNYELDKTVKHTKGSSGVVRRLAVAVILNNKLDPAKGKAAPLSDTELKQATALAKEAVGFNKDRGDTVNVANVAFAPREQEMVPDTPLWKDPWLIATVKDIGKWLLFVFLAWLLWTRAFKPLFEMLAATAHRVEAEQEAAAGAAAASESHGAVGHGRSYESKLQQARDLAKQDPKLVAGVIKEWVGGESR
jgi:flagellar M-ring protein FliF